MKNSNGEKNSKLTTALIIIGVIVFFGFWTAFIMINEVAGSISFLSFIVIILLVAIFKGKKSSTVPVRKTNTTLTPESIEKMNKLIKLIKLRTEIDAYTITLEEKENIDIFKSKFGGVPYWDLSQEYPTDSLGNKLTLLAQINFEKENFEDDRLPKKGILQFFISSDDVYGIDFKNPDIQKDWKVVFHKDINNDVTKEEIIKLNIPTSISLFNEKAYFPVEKEYLLKFNKEKAHIGQNSYNFDSIVKNILKNEFSEEISDETRLYDCFKNEEYDYLMEQMQNFGHKLLGYPEFTQTDPRAGTDGSALQYYNTLLLQIDSSDGIMWGDSGVCNFFINNKDLKSGDFSKILYNWDCY